MLARAVLLPADAPATMATPGFPLILRASADGDVMTLKKLLKTPDAKDVQTVFLVRVVATCAQINQCVGSGRREHESRHREI